MGTVTPSFESLSRMNTMHFHKYMASITREVIILVYREKEGVAPRYPRCVRGLGSWKCTKNNIYGSLRFRKTQLTGNMSTQHLRRLRKLQALIICGYSSKRGTVWIIFDGTATNRCIWTRFRWLCNLKINLYSTTNLLTFLAYFSCICSASFIQLGALSVHWALFECLHVTFSTVLSPLLSS